MNIFFFFDLEIRWEFQIQYCTLPQMTLWTTKPNFLLFGPISTKLFSFNRKFIAIWTNNKDTINSIIKIQKEAFRSINGSTSKNHTEPIFKKHKILKFSDLLEINKLTITHAIFHNYSPKALYEQSHIQIETQHERLKRIILNLKIYGSNKKLITKNLISITWNNLNPQHKIFFFKSKLTSIIKNSIIKNYLNTEICNNNSCKTCK